MAPARVFDQILDYDNRANPYPLYTELRRTPVSRADDGSYVVSTYREIVALLHDPRVSSDLRHRADYGVAGDDEGVPGLPPNFITLDPPDHDRVRRLLTRQFGPPHDPGRIVRLVPDLAEIVTGVIDDFASRNQVDLVDGFAYSFPVTVICRLLGVPREDQPRFRVWADAVIETIDPTTGDFTTRRCRRDQALAELARYLGGLADAHRDHPGDDMLSGLVTDDGPQGRLSREELMTYAALLLIAGHETTVNLITNGMLTLLRHPDVLQRLRRQPDLAIPVVEELLRYEPPVQFLQNRVALDDIDVAGTTIPHSAPITLVLAALVAVGDAAVHRLRGQPVNNSLIATALVAIVIALRQAMQGGVPARGGAGPRPHGEEALHPAKRRVRSGRYPPTWRACRRPAPGVPHDLHGACRAVRQCRAAALAVVLAAGARILPVMLLLAGSAPVYLGRRRVIAAWPTVSAAAPAHLTWWQPSASRRAEAPFGRRDEHVYPQ